MTNECGFHYADAVPEGHVAQNVIMERYCVSRQQLSRLRGIGMDRNGEPYQRKIGEANAHGMVYLNEEDVKEELGVKPVKVYPVKC